MDFAIFLRLGFRLDSTPWNLKLLNIVDETNFTDHKKGEEG